MPIGSFRRNQRGKRNLGKDLEQHLVKGDEFFENFKKAVDQYVVQAGLHVPEERLHSAAIEQSNLNGAVVPK